MIFRFFVTGVSAVGIFVWGWPLVFGLTLGLIWAVSFNLVKAGNLG